MRLIFIAILFFISTTLVSQDCNDPHCQRLLESLRKIEYLNKTIEDERVNLRRANTQLQEAKSNEVKSQTEIARLQNDFNSLNERINQLVNELNTKQREYNEKLEEARTLINQNEGQRKVNQELVKFIEELEAEREVTANDAIAKANDLEIRNFMDTWLNDMELGYEKDGKIIVTKIYDGENISYERLGLMGKNLNRLNVKGKFFVNKKQGIAPLSEIKGKLLIYSDHLLIDVIDNSLELVAENEYETFSEYTIKYERGNVLNKKVNEKASALVRISFVDNEKYNSKSKSEFENFWNAKNTGLLQMTTVKPKFPNVKLTDKETVKNAMIVGSTNVTSDEIALEIYDYGKFDGDQATFYLNNVELITNLNLGKREKPFVKENIHLKSGKNYLTIMANQTGTVEPCTAAINIKNSNGAVIQSIKLSAKVGYCERFEIVR